MNFISFAKKYVTLFALKLITLYKNDNKLQNIKKIYKNIFKFCLILIKKFLGINFVTKLYGNKNNSQKLKNIQNKADKV